MFISRAKPSAEPSRFPVRRVVDHFTITRCFHPQLLQHDLSNRRFLNPANDQRASGFRGSQPTGLPVNKIGYANSSDGRISEMLRARLHPTSNQLRELEKLRAELVATSLPTKCDLSLLAAAFLGKLQISIEYRAAAVYLLDKRGCLERLATAGQAGFFDALRCSFPDGREVLTQLLEPVEPLGGDVHLGRDHELARLRTYRVGLRGSSQVFGLVELFCDCVAGVERQQDQMSGHDCICIATSSLASAITTFRSRNESIVLASVSRFLSEADPQLEFRERPDSFFSRPEYNDRRPERLSSGGSPCRYI